MYFGALECTWDAAVAGVRRVDASLTLQLSQQPMEVACTAGESSGLEAWLQAVTGGYRRLRAIWRRLQTVTGGLQARATGSGGRAAHSIGAPTSSCITVTRLLQGCYSIAHLQLQLRHSVCSHPVAVTT